MLEFLNSLLAVVKKQKVVIDTVSNQMVYRVLTLSLLACCAISQFRQFSTSQISCMSGSEISKEVADQFCATVGTFTYPQPSESDRWAINNYKVAVNNVGDWAEAYPGVRRYELTEPERQYNRIAIFVPVYFLLLAIFAYTPHMLWRKLERKTIFHLVQELNQPCSDEKKIEKNIENSARYFNGTIKDHKRYTLYFLIVHFLYVMVLVVQMQILYAFTNTEYTYLFGYEVMKHLTQPVEERPHGLSSRFPLIAKCEFRYWSIAGKITNTSNLCTMPLNEVYQLLFGFHWWLLCVALVFEVVGMFSHLIQIIFPVIRRWKLRYFLAAKKDSEASKVISRLNFGSGFVVDMMHKNMAGYLLTQILEEVSLNLET